MQKEDRNPAKFACKKLRNSDKSCTQVQRQGPARQKLVLAEL